MNEAALKQLPVNMHDLEEEGNANGFVCLSVCPTKLYFEVFPAPNVYTNSIVVCLCITCISI